MPLTLAILLCVLVHLESWPVGQFQLGRPVLLLPLLGLLLGQPLTGLWLGLVLELLTLRSLPMGAALPPDPALAGCWSLVALELGSPSLLDQVPAGAAPSLALVVALPLCWLAPWLTEAQRRINGRWWRPRFEAAAEQGDARACDRLMGATLLQTALLGAAASLIVLAGLRALGWMLVPLGTRLAEAGPAGGPGLPWLLLAVALGGLWRHAGGRRGTRSLWLGAGAGLALALLAWAGRLA
jgi:PTS system mannose-specific IIC component